MSLVEIPVLDEKVVSPDHRVKKIVTEKGRVRLAELEDELPYSHTELRLVLFRLLEQGDVAVFPVGDSVQVRDERN